MIISDKEKEEFIALLKNSPDYILNNVMCYYHYNNGGCKHCPLHSKCNNTDELYNLAVKKFLEQEKSKC